MTIQVIPLPHSYLEIPKRLRPHHPPIFPDSVPTREEIEVAIALVEALDVESFDWYGGTAAVERLRARLSHHDA